MAANTDSKRPFAGGSGSKTVTPPPQNATAGSDRSSRTSEASSETLNTDRNGNELTSGTTPGELLANDETRAPESEGGDVPRPGR